MSPPRRALVAVTSAKAHLIDHTTGVFIGEALHPYHVFTAAGYKVDIASEKGVWTADDLSISFLTEDEKKEFQDSSSAFRTEMDKNKKASDLNPEDYGIFYASAGHAALIDFPHAKDLQKIASTVYQNGGVVSAVCHGAAIFPGVVDKDGKPVVTGRKITGFTTQAEDEMKVTDTLRTWGEPLVDEHAKNLGAEYVRSEGVWDDFSIADGRIVTGQNPQSATSCAKKALEVFEKQ